MCERAIGVTPLKKMNDKILAPHKPIAGDKQSQNNNKNSRTKSFLTTATAMSTSSSRSRGMNNSGASEKPKSRPQIFIHDVLKNFNLELKLFES